MRDHQVREVQRCFPKIYLACHAEHVRTKSNPHHVSSHDSSLLTHLDEDGPILAGELARHLGVTGSTLSAALQRLETLGHLKRRPRPGDLRKVEVTLTATGAAAVASASVLDSSRLKSVLSTLSPSDRRKAVNGLVLLAEAATQFQTRSPRRKRW